MIPWLSADIVFPPISSALTESTGLNGLLAAGGDLSPPRLLAAYTQGIFPWYSPGEPILWWSPDPRMVLFPDEIKISRSLAKKLRNPAYSIRFDTAFSDVISACARQQRPGQNGTWISSEIIVAYEKLHRLGYAHSVETWIDGELAGGLYGIAIGRAFYGESMFSQVRDGSKIAFAHLCAYLRQQEFGIIDCQMETPHLISLGARLIARSDFIAKLETLIKTGPAPGLWPATAIDGYFKRAR
jgi:leucyl/phenylalanyl-tRNA--protein transferase